LDSPFFLVGSERSGSTLLRLMLDHHPEIACNLESDFLVAHVTDQGGRPAVSEYAAFLRRDRVFRHSRFAIDESLDYQGLVESFLAQKRLRDGKRLVGATVHHHFDRLLWLWPEAKFVYLLRDGRDVANSAVGMGWAGNAYCGADIWIDAERRWAEMRAGLDPAASIEVRYEELVASPVDTLSRVCAFLGTTYSDQMLSYPRSSSYGAPSAALASQWRSNMDPEELRLVEARIGALLAARGYPLVDPAPRPVGRAHEAWLRLQSRVRRIRYRIDRFGLPLTLGEFLARRLGLGRWQASAQRRLDAIVDQGLK